MNIVEIANWRAELTAQKRYIETEIRLFSEKVDSLRQQLGQLQRQIEELGMLESDKAAEAEIHPPSEPLTDYTVSSSSLPVLTTGEATKGIFYGI